MKILVIEDEYELLKSVETFLLSENYVVESATDYMSGIEKVNLYEYDCILLDISLPGGSGLKILEDMKQKGIGSNTIIISAKNSLEDKITGLDLGADDYLTKPFHLAELHARIKAVLRRKQLDGKDTISLGNITIDFNRHLVYMAGKEMKFNRKEFDILCFFATNQNRLITKEVLAEHVWGDNIDSADNFDFVYAQMKNLRKKLKDNGASVSIDNVYGVGYKMTI
ncbi:MAG: response regulator transcription factor [Dysgonomonas sp.]|nr:response regulator transcription factor [Dysgonomonas sp.]